MHALVIADAPNADLSPYAALLHAAPLVIAADGGARYALALGRTPDLLVGDLDSLDQATLTLLEQTGTAIERHPAAKNETDLELGLLVAIERGATEITLLAALGGRPDMHLANQLLLAHPAITTQAVALRDAGWTTRLLSQGELVLHGTPGKRVSLLPLSASAGIVTSGLRYPLRDEPLALGPARGVSNEFAATQASISLRSGCLLIISED